MKMLVKDVVNGKEFKSIMSAAKDAELTRIRKLQNDAIVRHSKETVDAAKLQGVNILASTVKKPLTDIVKVRVGV